MKLLAATAGLLAVLVLFCSKNPADAPELPAAPAGLVVTDSSYTTLLLQWSDVSGATGYIVYRVIASNSLLALDTVTATSFIVNGLQSDSTYTFQVSAYNANGEGVKCGTLTAKTRAGVFSLSRLLGLPGYGGPCLVRGDSLYIACDSTVLVYDIMSPALPMLVGTIKLGSLQIMSLACSGANLVCGVRNMIFLADLAAVGGPAVVDSFSFGVQILPTGLCFSGTGSTIFVGTSSMGLGIHGVFAFDCTDPADIALLDSISLSNNVRSVSASGNTVFAGVIDSTVQVVTFNPTDSSLSLTTTVSTAPGEVQGVLVDGNRCYAATYDGAHLSVLNIANPALTNVLGAYTYPDSIWDMPKILRMVGPNMVCVAGFNLSLIDVANPAVPVLKGMPIEMPEVPIYGLAAANGYAYVVCGNNANTLAVVRINLN